MSNNDIQYIEYKEAIHVYQRTIAHSGGGTEGVLNEGGIRSVLDFVQNDMYYPDFSSKLTYLMFRFCTGHFFNDGNKRIALTLGTFFLHKNGMYWHACIAMKYFEAIIFHVAASHIDQDLFSRIVQCFIKGEDEDEALKIEIAKAMNNGSLGIDGEDYNMNH